MNNTKSLLLIAIITATLVMGTSVLPMQSYADRDNNDDHKKTKDFKSSIIAGSESDKKSASQRQDQDNFCYRGDDCEQANQGQQIVGKDNDAKGFNDQSENLAVTAAAAGAGNGTGTGNGTTPTPTPKTCEECLMTFLTHDQQERLLSIANVESLAVFCVKATESTMNSESQFSELLKGIGVSQDNITQLIACLKDAGIKFNA